MIDKSKILKLTENHLKGTDKYIVDIHITNNNIIDLFIDSEDSVSIADCVELSRYLESNLDRAIEDYELNVSSAGLDQPFKVFKQYLKNLNNEVSVLLKDGRKFEGILISATHEKISLEIPANKKKKTEKQEFHFLINEIKETKSIISFKK